MVGAETDNQGNPFATAKLLSTKFPLNVLLMQLATCMEVSGLYLNLKWVPRDENKLADALTNEDFSSFTPSKRVRAKLDQDTFPTLFCMLGEAKKLFDEVESTKAERAKQARAWPKIPNHKRLKVAQPW